MLDLEAACPLTIPDALHRASQIAAGLPAVITPDERVTYRELVRAVARQRAALVASGVRPGDHVAICLGNGPRWVSLFLAIGSIGAVTVPVNTRFRADELGYVLRHSRARLLIVVDRLLSTDFIDLLRHCLPAVDATLPDASCPDLREVVVIGSDVPRGATPWTAFEQRTSDAALSGRPRPDDIALIQYTSGTTARPKGVQLRHRSVCANAYFSGLRTGLRVGDRFFSPRPFFHVAGSTLSVLACLQHGATLVTVPRFLPAPALQLMADERCTHFSGNDTIALMLLNEAHRPRLALRGAWLAATPSVVRRVIDELGATESVVGYGLSEAAPNVAQSAWWDDEESRVAGLMHRQPDVEVRIRDPATGEVCPPGQPGEILVRGWNVMAGYLDQPAESAAVLSPEGWLATGDLGRLDAAGRLSFLGRHKEIIRVGGENVAPAEIESFLSKHPAVELVQVVGVPDDRLIEVPCAYIELRDGATATAEDFIEFCRGSIASYKVPRHVRIITDWPMSATKIQRYRLREMFLAESAAV